MRHPVEIQETFKDEFFGGMELWSCELDVDWLLTFLENEHYKLSVDQTCKQGKRCWREEKVGSYKGNYCDDIGTFISARVMRRNTC